MSEFAKKVKELMYEKKLTQSELSKLSGVSQPSLCRYLRGDIAPRADVIQNIAKAFGVSFDYLVGRSEERTPSETSEEIKRLVARNRNILTKEDKIEIISILYGDGS